MKQKRTYGGEIEKVVSNKATGHPYGVSQNYYKSLVKQAKQRNVPTHAHKSDLKPEVTVGIVSDDLGEQGLDNGFNLLETSLPVTTSLKELHKKQLLDLSVEQKALDEEGATVINMAIHPLGDRSWDNYVKYVAPKGTYSYLWYRGWDHTSGIDARAQNSPSTGVSVENAIDAFSVIIGAGAAFIGIFANSPYEEGKRAKYKESRLTMWDRMFSHSQVKGDLYVSKFPPKRFTTLGEYFSWMFGRGTGIMFTIAENSARSTDYKGTGDRIVVIEGNPSLLEFLSKKSVKGTLLKDLLMNFPPKLQEVIPHISHMEALQFHQFAGARIRYAFKNHDNFPIKEFIEGCKNPESKKVEEIFSEFTNFTYIEGRDPGANFPDKELASAGKLIANSVVISPSALQAGLIQNLSEAIQYIDGFKWEHLAKLRDAAIKDGLEGTVDGVSVYSFAKKMVQIAARGLSQADQQYLAYPEWVLKTKQNGADRAIKFVESQTGRLEKRIEALVKEREVVC